MNLPKSLFPHFYSFQSLILTLSLLTTALSINISKRANAEESPFLVYQQLTHQINIKNLRTGNHGRDGKESSYYFKVILFALLAHEKELGPDNSARKKVEAQIGEFAHFSLNPLSLLSINVKNKDMSFTVQGEEIRHLVAQAMSQFKVSEDQVIIETHIVFYRQNKKYFIWPNDQIIARLTYQPIPDKKSNQPLREDLTLDFKDPLGTFLTLAIEYPPPA